MTANESKKKQASIASFFAAPAPNRKKADPKATGNPGGAAARKGDGDGDGAVLEISDSPTRTPPPATGSGPHAVSASPTRTPAAASTLASTATSTPPGSPMLIPTPTPTPTKAEPPPSSASKRRRAASAPESEAESAQAPAAAKKRRAKAKAAAPQPSPEPAASPDAAAPTVALEALDPATRARVTSYQHKLDELTRLCARLSVSRDPEDAVLQEIYGVGLDADLDTDKDADADPDKELSAWLAAPSDSGGDSMPAVLKRFVAHRVQGQVAGLSELAARVLAALADASGSDAQVMDSNERRTQLEMEIKMLAQRTAYGARPARANLYEDASGAALWCWEVTNLDMYFDETAQKTVKRMRRQRKRVGAQIKSLARVVQLLGTQQDDAKASQEEAKIGRFVALVEAEEQKARERERKETQKAQALEEKRRVDQERLQAKEDEKKRREQEQEAQRALSAKRRNDEEWEEEEPGESLSGAESDQDESDDDQLDYGDDWLAYEDEIEYEEGAGEADELGPMVDEDDMMLPMGIQDAEEHRKRRRDAKQQRRGRRVAAEHKKQKLTKLEPLVVGPFR
ncbi:hypothetical protein ATCC90586_007059 [Pythium insidiosum]|nr:hypothetical protein ATCC90586_007059 [Pythium insidiosum]